MLLSGDLQYVDESVHLDVPGEEGFALSCSGEQCGEIVYGIYVVFVYDVGYLLGVADIGYLCRSAGQELAFRLSPGYISCYGRATRKVVPQFHCKLGSDLSRRADYENILHYAVNLKSVANLL